MGKAKKAAIAFIDDISDDHLTNLKSKSGTITKDTNFRLDMQGVRQNRRQTKHSERWTNSRIVHDRIEALQPPDSNQQWDLDQYAEEGEGQDCEHGLSPRGRGMECCRYSSQIQRKLKNLRENLQDRVDRMNVGFGKREEEQGKGGMMRGIQRYFILQAIIVEVVNDGWSSKNGGERLFICID